MSRRPWFIYLLLWMLMGSTPLFAQDTLPRITVHHMSKKVVVSWRNNYGARISTLNIQRSKDSLKGFTTIGSVLNPTARENGYVDAKAPDTLHFYRVFVAFEGGDYFFSKSSRPKSPPPIDPTRDEAENDIPGKGTEDTLTTSIPTKPTVNVFVPSKWVFTGKDNNLVISLPEAGAKTYALTIYTVDSVQLFQIGSIKEPYLILEKSNFMRAGWYRYELKENGTVKENHKFYIAKEGNKGVILPPPPDKKQPPR